MRVKDDRYGKSEICTKLLPWKWSEQIPPATGNNRGGITLVGKVSDRKSRRNTDSGSIPPYKRDFFFLPESALSDFEHLNARHKSQIPRATPLSGHTELVRMGSATTVSLLRKHPQLSRCRQRHDP